MSVQQPWADRGVQSDGSQCSDTGDKAIDQRGYAELCGGQITSAQCSNFKTTQTLQNIKWLVAAELVVVKRTLNNLGLEFNAL